MKFFSLLILLLLFVIASCVETEIEVANEPTADTDSGVDVHAGNELGSPSGKDDIASVEDDNESDSEDDGTIKLF